ncbi:homologous recombination OB-fold protein [Hemiscyllium ocellatum]|uniref:homologous recombination OB-fold protein n=1 Tax=Hemiscyllium ocellatum TaxID=170820 RepID=UPI002967675D|nr:homologous recombination OB-fold protein [Hemiscyllium ocellatum]
MACSFQKLFSVDEEFDDDDDLLSAALDVEKTTTSSSGGNPCVRLRPIASILRTPANSSYEPKSLSHGTLGQRYCQLEYGCTSKYMTNNYPTKSAMAASIDSSESNNWNSKQKSTPDLKQSTTEVGSVEEIDDLFWSDCEELEEDGNVPNTTLRKISSPRFLEKTVVTPRIIPSPKCQRNDLAVLPAKLPRHEKTDTGKSESSKVTVSCKNSQTMIQKNYSETARKTSKFHPSFEFNQCPTAVSNSNSGGIRKQGDKNSSEIIESHGHSATLSNVVPRTEFCSSIPYDNIRSAKELTPVPQNHLGTIIRGSAIGSCKLVSSNLQTPSPPQQVSSTGIKNCLNPMLLRPKLPLQNSSIPKHSNGDVKRATMSTSDPRPLICGFESPSAAIGAQYSPATNSGCVGTPVTNHLIQLVSAANRTPEAVRLDRPRPKRRFPGPAGILPQQHLGKNLDDVLISDPQTPTHGAVPKLRPQEVPGSQQSVEDDFGRGPWATMKADLRLDEEDADCFLRSYSIVMVLRKAALKQLPKGKVPKMAVLVKSLTRTNTDASAVFKDPSGEMQGTIHRQLLVEELNNLKVGTVLLLKQVGVFSPSLRNHYLNITRSNVIRIYPQDASECIRNQLDQSPENHIAFQHSTFDFVAGSPCKPRCESLMMDRNSCTDSTSWASQTPPPCTRDKSMALSEYKGTALQEYCAENWEEDGLDCLMAELPEELFTPFLEPS